jgi:anaphase-promoting complex subunit 2
VVCGMGSTCRVRNFLIQLSFPLISSSCSAILSSAYTLNFRTLLFSVLPPSFSQAFKELCTSLLSPASESHSLPRSWNECVNSVAWKNFEILGLIDRYESVIASAGYEFIERHVLEVCTGRWDNPMLEDLRTWMSDRMVPWMLSVYARAAQTRMSYLKKISPFHIN